MLVLPGAGQRSSLDSPRRRAWRRLTTVAATAVALLGVAAPAHAALSAVGAINPLTKFPTFYQDATGLQLAPCPVGTANCLLAPAAPPTPSTYANFDARFLTAGPAHNGRIDVTDALAALMGKPGGPNAVAAPAQPIAENKLVVTGNGLRPNSTYTITYPFGTVTIGTDAGGAIAHGPASVLDFAGCLAIAAPIPPPCDFALALPGVMGPFLRQDPHVAPAPAGFIGNSLLAEPFVGSPTGNNFVRIDGPDAGGIGVNSITTDKAFITGKLAPAALVTPLAGGPAGADLGAPLIGTASATKKITISNDATVPLAISGITLGGANAGDFAIAPTSTCPVAGGSVAPAPGALGRCTVDVTFTPSAAGSRSATLTVADNVASGPVIVALTGTGTAPAVAPAPAPAPQVVPNQTPALRIAALTLSGRTSLRFARRHGLHAVVFAPDGAKVILVKLVRKGRTIDSVMRRVTADGVVKLVMPHTRSARRALRRGTYQLLLTPGASPSQLGATTVRTVTLH